MIDIPSLKTAIARIEERVDQLDKWAKECADKGDYSGAAQHQRTAVDLHCAVDVIKGKHVCGIKDFSHYYGDVCERCTIDAEIDAAKEGK